MLLVEELSGGPGTEAFFGLEVCHKEEKWCGEGSETGRVFKGETPYPPPPPFSRKGIYLYTVSKF
jgi:hypothetical protein